MSEAGTECSGIKCPVFIDDVRKENDIIDGRTLRLDPEMADYSADSEVARMCAERGGCAIRSELIESLESEQQHAS